MPFCPPLLSSLGQNNVLSKNARFCVGKREIRWVIQTPSLSFLKFANTYATFIYNYFEFSPLIQI